MLFSNSGSKPLKRLLAITNTLSILKLIDRFLACILSHHSFFICQDNQMLRQRRNEAQTTIAYDFTHIEMGDSAVSVLGKVQAIPNGHIGNPGIFV